MTITNDLSNFGLMANAMYNSMTANATAITSLSVGTANSANLTTTTNVATIGTSTYFVANGNVGIGTASPGVKLEVSGAMKAISSVQVTDGSFPLWQLYNSGLATNPYYRISYDSSNNVKFENVNAAYNSATEHMRISSAGYVMIGTTTPNGLLTVNGTGPILNNQAFAYYATSGGTTITGYASGQNIVNSIWANGRIAGGEFNAYSDSRLKKDITPIPSNDAWNLIKNVTPVHYRWKDSVDDGHKFGFIAQDLIKAGFPNLVGQYDNSNMEETTDKDGFTSPAGISLTVNYDQIIPMLATALYDVSLDLEKKDAEIEALKARLDALEKKLN